MLFRKKTRSRFGDTFKMMSIWLLAVLGLTVISGCGQRYIQIDLNRPENFSQPVWVGVYFLSKERALDDMDNNQLADPEGVVGVSGVLDKLVRPLYPGEVASPILMKDYDKEIRWVVVAAGFPEATRCARLQVPVKEDAELKIQVTVNKECISLEMD